MSSQPIKKSVVLEKTCESGVDVPQPFQDPTKRIKKWLLIRIGMEMNMVKDILGNPDRVSQIGGNSYWYYDDGGLQFSKTSTNVVEYDYQFGKFDQDLSRWGEIKKGMTKANVISVLGNPWGVDVQMNYDDTNEHWSYLDKKDMGVIYFDHTNKIYEFNKKSREEVEAAGEEVKKKYSL